MKHDLSYLRDKDVKAEAAKVMKEMKKDLQRRFQAHING